MERPETKNIPTLVKDPDLVARRRRQIIDAAAHLFVRKGFHQTTTREIAAAAGFSIGTLYEYIKSKEDVLYLVCDAIHEAVETDLKRAAAQSGTGRQALIGAVRGYFSVCDQLQDHILLIYQESGSLSPESRAYVLANEERITAIFEQILNLGVGDGSLTIDGPEAARLMAHNITVWGHMWTFRRWSLRRYYDLKEYTRLQLSTILNDIAAENAYKEDPQGGK